MASRFVWPSYKQNIRKWCKSCLGCQKSKITTHTTSPLMRRLPPERQFGSLHLDLVGPLPESKEIKYVMTVVDRFTQWMEAIPLPDISAETCVQAFLLNLVARYGVPGDVVADRGAQFYELSLATPARAVGHQEPKHHPVPPGRQWPS